MSLVEISKTSSATVLTINKPHALNALSSESLSALSEALDQVEQDQQLRCLVITGAGDKAFVAGADIKEINTLDVVSARSFAEQGQKVFRRIESFRVPVIAAVNGFALGGGLELAMACDFILASEKAKFGLPECTLGLMPGFGGSVRLARKIGPGRAKQLTYTGDMMSADQALACGLVNEIHSAETLMDSVERVAKTISMRAPLALNAIKQTIDQTYGLRVDQAMVVEAQAFSQLFESQDVKEGTSAFIEKRKPEFTGK